jgi:tetratricopeptide (TPR) repeat protein
VRRAAALWVVGFQAARAGEFERPDRLLRRSLELFRKLGKGYETIRCLCELATIAQEHGRGTEATELAEQARAIAHELADPRAVSAASTCLGTLSYWDGDFARAADLYEDALRGWRETNAQPRLIVTSLYNIGLAARALEDYDRAERALVESLEVATRAAYAVIIGNAATGLGYVMLARNELDRARSLLAKGLNVLAEVANPPWTASALNLAAAVAVAEGDNRAAARFWGAVDALVGDAIPLEVPDERVRRKFEGVARAALEPGEFDAALEEGRHLPLEQVVEFVTSPAAENRR